MKYEGEDMDMRIDTGVALTSSVINKWENAKALIEKSVINIVEVDASLAMIARGDFYMLLSRNNVPTEYWYPHLMVNGLKSSGDYDGVNTKVKLLDVDALDKIMIS